MDVRMFEKSPVGDTEIDKKAYGGFWTSSSDWPNLDPDTSETFNIDGTRVGNTDPNCQIRLEVIRPDSDTALTAVKKELSFERSEIC